MVVVLSVGKLSSCREGAQISGARPRLLVDDEGPKQGLSQKLCIFCSWHSHLHSLVSERSRTRNGSPRCSVKFLPGGADTSPLAGKMPRCLGSASEAVLQGPWGCPPTLCPFTLHPLIQCSHQLGGTCDPGQARFSDSLMLSQVLRDCIGTEVVFHSLVVLRSCGESSRGPWGCLSTLHPR